jgi:hypothetical protein
VNAKQWINFVRLYGPIPTKDNLYDENLRRQARRRGISQILFEHPFEKPVMDCFDLNKGFEASVILTGTAGDGKTFLCGRVWEQLGGDAEIWAGQETHCQHEVQLPADTGGVARKIRLHVLRDLSAWVPVQGADWPPEKRDLMLRFCRSLYVERPHEVFLIAANDGQLAETFRRLLPSSEAQTAKELIEELLFTDRENLPGLALRLFNLSRGSSVLLFKRALDAFLSHEGWEHCKKEASSPDKLFGDECPIRRNYELLGSSLVRNRLIALLELCDQNSLHVPVRQILILLSNSILGHPEAKDYLMSADDVPRIISENCRSLASIYNNIFGGNLSENRRANLLIFEYLERFQIGRETSNRFDNILIFGASHEYLQEQFSRLVEADRFYGADVAYAAARRNYIEGTDESPVAAKAFLYLLVSQRRRLFFVIPNEEVEELKLWDLTVFKYGGEYLDYVLGSLRKGESIRRHILGRIVRGMNRIFTGMLINNEHELFLASSASLSQAPVSRFLDERISVTPRHGGEKVEVLFETDRPYLFVCLGGEFSCKFQLTLTRYEYLSRVAEGAMPNSFSKECFEDVMAFKSRLMRELQARDAGHSDRGEAVFRVIEVDGNGAAREERIGVLS